MVWVGCCARHSNIFFTSLNVDTCLSALVPADVTFEYSASNLIWNKGLPLLVLWIDLCI